MPPISGRHLRAIWSHKDLLGGPGAARCEDADGPCMHACCVRAAMRECTDCDPTGVRVAFARMIFRGPRAQNSDPLSTLDPDKDSRCFGDGIVHRINVVWSFGRVAFVPRRTSDPLTPLFICSLLPRSAGDLAQLPASSVETMTAVRVSDRVAGRA